MENKIKFILNEMGRCCEMVELSDNLINAISYDDDGFRTSNVDTLNKYEFQHMCKELMKENWLCVWSGNGYNKSIGYECSVTHFMFGDVKTFKADTEFEAVIDATYALLNYEVDFDEDES